MNESKQLPAELVVRQTAVDRLVPNTWNPNRMSPEMRHKLKVYIQREGFVEPLVVRPQGDRFEILGGFHRWVIARELGYQSVPCTIVNLDDRRAKILSINLNELKGQSVPQLLAQVIHDLEAELTLEDLETQLPYTLAELKDFDRLLQIPDGLAAFIDDEIAKQEKERPTILSFAVENAEVVEQAIAKASARQSGVTSRGRALVMICQAYLHADRDPAASGNPFDGGHEQ